MKPNPTPEGETMEAMSNQAGRSDEQRVLAVWPDTIVYFNKIMKRWLWWRESDPSKVSDHFDTEAEAWANAASRLPKAEVAPEHPRADCEGCGDPNCPCNLIDADGFLEWWRDNNQRFEASDSFTHPIDYAAAGWNAAKASSPAVAGGESETLVRVIKVLERAARFITKVDDLHQTIYSNGLDEDCEEAIALLKPFIKDVRGKG